MQVPHQLPHWTLATRVLFRYCFVYFSLFCLTTQIVSNLIPLPGIEIPDPSEVVRSIVFWTASHVFGVTHPLVYTGSGSGDKTFDWVLVFCLLILAGVVAGIWSVLDRKRRDYATLHKWFRLGIRFALASEMILYGMSKVIPLQMPFPYSRNFSSHLVTSLPWGSSGRPSALLPLTRSSPGVRKRWLESC